MSALALPRLWTPPERKVILRAGILRPTEACEELFPWMEPGDRRLVEKYLTRPSEFTPRDFIRFMAGSKTNFAENAVKNAIGNAASLGAPATWHVGLWTAALSDTSTGSTGNEANYGSYARVAKTANTTNFATVGDNTSLKNSTAITFPTSSGTQNVVTYTGFTSASSGGNMWLWADLTASRTIDTAETPEFAVDAFTYDED